MLGVGGGGGAVWLLCRVSLVFVVNSSVPSFTGAAVLMMPACVELCETPPCGGHYLEGLCPLTSSQPVDSYFPSSFLPIKCGVVVPSHLAVFYGSAARFSKSQRARASVSFFFFFKFNFSLSLSHPSFYERMFIFPFPIF